MTSADVAKAWQSWKRQSDAEAMVALEIEYALWRRANGYAPSDKWRAWYDRSADAFAELLPAVVNPVFIERHP